MNKKERTKRKIAIRNEVGEGADNTKHWNKRKGVHRHGDSYLHFMVKSAIYEILDDAGHEVRTEVEIQGGYVIDVVDADEAIFYEVETGLTKSIRKDKYERYLKYNKMDNWISDIIFLDPTDAPQNLAELRDWLKDRHLVL